MEKHVHGKWWLFLVLSIKINFVSTYRIDAHMCILCIHVAQILFKILIDYEIWSFMSAIPT